MTTLIEVRQSYELRDYCICVKIAILGVALVTILFLCLFCR